MHGTKIVIIPDTAMKREVKNHLRHNKQVVGGVIFMVETFYGH